MSVPERDEAADETVADETPPDGQRGPWLLALGALAIGVLAFLASGARALLERLRRR
ncbi:hypothetical protein [Halomarina oriensis]|uniref:Uncharacterized protein n=1 Tax=Halomarina oriensis TaxID=671145 RepID=A0A6B0GIW8_9EURY|nr:hypothetical protein [Halomarina oriensis]MWG34580.1 hypothetical protein [Halomarina oriensis]